MGAPKQKWTAEEEAALKAGIQKYGLGKWSTILKDPEFSTALQLRSNVDLKDKWRNLNCMTNGSGSRQRARVSDKNVQLSAKPEEDSTPSLTMQKDLEVTHMASGAASSDKFHDVASVQQIPRLDELILEAITKLKEPRGSTRPSIAQYIEEHCSPSPDFERSLAANLKMLAGSGHLIKVKSQYRLAPKRSSSAPENEQPLLLANASEKDPSGAEKSDVVPLTKSMVDADLEKMKYMSAEEAVKAAAKAVAEAEVAIAEAEKAAQEAEEAEAEAEASRSFVDLANKALTWPTIRA